MLQPALLPRKSPRRSPRLVPAVGARRAGAPGAERERRAPRVSDLSRQLGLSKSTLSELLGTLEHFGFVERDGDSHAFRLGHAQLELGNAVPQDFDLRQVASPYLVHLRDTIGGTAVLHVPGEGGALIVDRVESDHQLKGWRRSATGCHPLPAGFELSVSLCAQAE